MTKITVAAAGLAGLAGKMVLAGVSGGADSLALLLLLCEAKAAVEAVHFEHGIRGGESRRDAAFVADFCETRNIPCRTVALDVPSGRARGENLEAAARRMRLESWKTLAADGTMVALGHHRNDAEENLLLRLGRGGNVSSLTALRRRSWLGGVEILRPLLEFTRREIEEFLLSKGVRNWCFDATNADCAYQRNFLRNKILPEWKKAFPPVGKGIAAALRALSDDADFIEACADREFSMIADAAATPASFWLDMHPALLARVLKRYFNSEEALSPARRRELLKFLGSPGDGETSLFGRVWRKHRGALTVAPHGAPSTFSWNWRESPKADTDFGRFSAEFSVMPGTPEFDPSTAWFAPDALPETLEISTRREGERFTAFSGRKKSLKQLFIDHKLTPDAKSAQPLLRSPDGEIVWIPNLANTRNYLASPGSTALRLRFSRTAASASARSSSSADNAPATHGPAK